MCITTQNSSHDKIGEQDSNGTIRDSSYNNVGEVDDFEKLLASEQESPILGDTEMSEVQPSEGTPLSFVPEEVFKQITESGCEAETILSEVPVVVSPDDIGSDVETVSTEGQDEPLDSVPSMPAPSDDMKEIRTSIGSLEQNVRELSCLSSKIAGEVREMHKLYHNEFADRLKSMQDELEQYREVEKGRVFDGILGEVAKLYCDYESNLETISDDKTRKWIGYLFDDIEQILKTNGAQKQKSNPGDKRNTRFCQVSRESSSTEVPEMHDTVVQSRSTGFYVENRPLVKELVDIYLYTGKAAEKSDEI